jgi:uracil-DNA glycosylase
MSAAGPPQGANPTPAGGSAAAKPQAWGDHTSAAGPLSGDNDHAPSKESVDQCRRCELWEHATQGVPGEGPRGARLMLVGEQPGDEEDVQGRPFVGPAGRLLRALLDEAGIPVEQVFLTNAVKHFYFEPRGKRRIHKTPMQRHIAACHVWLEGELARERPGVIVTLGATALAAVYGSRIAITQARERKIENPHGTPVVATYHPSAILRAPDQEGRAKLRATLVADLKRATKLAGKS